MKQTCLSIINFNYTLVLSIKTRRVDEHIQHTGSFSFFLSFEKSGRNHFPFIILMPGSNRTLPLARHIVISESLSETNDHIICSRDHVSKSSDGIC